MMIIGFWAVPSLFKEIGLSFNIFLLCSLRDLPWTVADVRSGDGKRGTGSGPGRVIAAMEWEYPHEEPNMPLAPTLDDALSGLADSGSRTTRVLL
jgi:hypothetical protein